jgi:hypothetical protein
MWGMLAATSAIRTERAAQAEHTGDALPRHCGGVLDIGVLDRRLLAQQRADSCAADLAAMPLPVVDGRHVAHHPTAVTVEGERTVEADIDPEHSVSVGAHSRISF